MALGNEFLGLFPTFESVGYSFYVIPVVLGLWKWVNNSNFPNVELLLVQETYPHFYVSIHLRNPSYWLDD